MALTTNRFATTGMHCGSCAMLIDMTVSELPGVDASKSDAASGSTVVTYDDVVVSAEQIVVAIRGAGYEATVE